MNWDKFKEFDSKDFKDEKLLEEVYQRHFQNAHISLLKKIISTKYPISREMCDFLFKKIKIINPVIIFTLIFKYSNCDILKMFIDINQEYFLQFVMGQQYFDLSLENYKQIYNCLSAKYYLQFNLSVLKSAIKFKNKTLINYIYDTFPSVIDKFLGDSENIKLALVSGHYELIKKYLSKLFNNDAIPNRTSSILKCAFEVCDWSMFQSILKDFNIDIKLLSKSLLIHGLGVISEFEEKESLNFYVQLWKTIETELKIYPEAFKLGYLFSPHTNNEEILNWLLSNYPKLFNDIIELKIFFLYQYNRNSKLAPILYEKFLSKLSLEELFDTSDNKVSILNNSDEKMQRLLMDKKNEYNPLVIEGLENNTYHVKSISFLATFPSFAEKIKDHVVSRVIIDVPVPLRTHIFFALIKDRIEPVENTKEAIQKEFVTAINNGFEHMLFINEMLQLNDEFKTTDVIEFFKLFLKYRYVPPTIFTIDTLPYECIIRLIPFIMRLCNDCEFIGENVKKCYLVYVIKLKQAEKFVKIYSHKDVWNRVKEFL